jgi:hypothetical protein
MSANLGTFAGTNGWVHDRDGGKLYLAPRKNAQVRV